LITHFDQVIVIETKIDSHVELAASDLSRVLNKQGLRRKIVPTNRLSPTGEKSYSPFTIDDMKRKWEYREALSKSSNVPTTPLLRAGSDHTELLWGSNDDEVGDSQESILNIDTNVTSTELSISSNMSENLSANVSSAIIPDFNSSSISQWVDISSIIINVSESSSKESLVKSNESSMDVGTVSNLEIKPTTKVNDDKIIRGKKSIGSQCDSKV